MTEEQALGDLSRRGVFRMAPGLWCDKSVPDLIAVTADHDNAVSVRSALERAGQLPDVRNE